MTFTAREHHSAADAPGGFILTATAASLNL